MIQALSDQDAEIEHEALPQAALGLVESEKGEVASMTNQRAFPVTEGHFQGEEWSGGMSLRDYFAAAVIHGIWAGGEYWDASKETNAARAYEQADAMLRARDAKAEATT